MENSTSPLTLEQQLKLRNFGDTMDKASLTQTKEMLMFVYTEMLKQQNSYNSLIKHYMGIT